MLRKFIIQIACSLIAFVGTTTFSNTLLAQNLTVKGQVTDAETKETLPFCHVWVKSTKNETLTDIDGNYLLTLPLQTNNALVCASMIGYDTICKKIVPNLPEQEISMALGSGTSALNEVVILAGENPAHPIIRNVVKRKDKNRATNLPPFQCESYSKTEVDLIHIDKKLGKSKVFQPFKFVFDNIDSTSDELAFLPVYMYEQMANTYHTPGDFKLKNIPTAEQTVGTNESLMEYVREVENDFDIYDDWFYLFNKSFAGPLSTSAFLYYEFYLIDSSQIEGHKSYKIRFKPRRKKETVFEGDMWVIDSSFAVERVTMKMPTNVNINLINRLILYQEFDFAQTRWLPVKSKIVINFEALKEKPGIIGRKTTTFKAYKFAETLENLKIPTIDAVDIDAADLKKDKAFWEQNRHESLSKNEQAVYTMIDSIKNVPIYKSYVDILETLLSGYKSIGKIDLGPYFSTYSKNPVEGHRFRLGIQTNQTLSERYRVGGYAAYGLQDKEWKYGAHWKWIMSRKPRIVIGASHVKDIISNSLNTESTNSSNWFSGFYRRPVLFKLTAMQESKMFYERYWKGGLSNKIILLNRTLTPLRHPVGAGTGFNYAYLRNPEIPTQVDTSLTTTEGILKFRYSQGEKYIDNAFGRTTITNRKPILEMQYTFGMGGKGVGANYHKVELDYSGRLDVNPIGWTSWWFTAGKTFGTLPMPLLHVMLGNESRGYDRWSFNGMNNYEFAADAFVTMNLTHHFEGLIFNKLPLLRRLNWREVASFRAVVGTMTTANLNNNKLNLFNPAVASPNNYIGFRVPNQPYMEADIGIENIFKVLKLSAVWRLNYLDNPEASPFSVRLGFDFNF
jgi:Family of unknown function (DUF5686)/CarboxypepD_reg-like domain